MHWERGHGDIEGARGAAKDKDVGRVLAPNEEDWWWLDTRHVTVSDVQVSVHCISHVTSCMHFLHGSVCHRLACVDGDLSMVLPGKMIWCRPLACIRGSA